MPRAALPPNEAARSAALKQYNILDTPAERGFDDLTALAAQICQVPMALISLVDAERQWFKSRVGLCVTETHRDHAFCAHALHREEPLIIRDATADPRTSDNPLVHGEPFIRFYAGIPLRNRDGFALGTLCVLDTQPRDLSASQIQTLQSLARQAVVQLDLRREAAADRGLVKAMKRSRFAGGRYAMLTFLLAMLGVAVAIFYTRQSIATFSGQRFTWLNERVLDEIARRTKLPVYGLKGARGVYAASHSVSREEFGAYVGSRDLPREFPGALGFGFFERVARTELDSFVARERVDGAPEFAVTPFPGTSSTADDLYVIKHIFPSERNRAVMGMDVGSDPVRRSAIERAVQTGDPTISAPINLVQDTRHRGGILMLVPVYTNGMPHSTPAERSAALCGILYSPVVIEDALAGIAAGTDGMLRFELRDADVADAAGGLFGMYESPASGHDVAADESGMLKRVSTISLGGRQWTVRTVTTPKFFKSAGYSAPWVAGIGGTSASVLLAALAGSMGRARARAFALAERMTADLSVAKDHAVDHSRQLNATAAMLRRTGEMARVGGWELDLRNDKITWSEEVYRIHELELGTTLTVDRAIEFYAPEVRQTIRSAIGTALADGTPWDLELPLITQTGKRIYVRAQGECVRENDVTIKLVGAFQDISARKLAEDQLRRTATHDKLTGLPNRALLNDRLERLLKRPVLDGTPGLAVLFMDFDRFKLTNDTLGHEAGDDLLKQIAERLRRCLRTSDSVGASDCGPTVGRLGGDEFVVLLDGITCLPDATAVADRLLGALAAPYRILGHEVVSTASIGIVTGAPHYARPEEMLRDADIAMYEAKLAGKGRYVVFDAAMYERIEKKVRTEADLRVAIETGQFTLVYQPIISLENAEHSGVEALLRWNHPTRGLVSPDEIIPVAEECGLILPIGEWVLRAACEQFARWQKSLGDFAPRTVSVNLSRKQLATRDLPQRIAAILHETGVAPERVHLEVTESAVMQDPAGATRLLQQLRDIGVKIDMDDFGTGHSSLAMLHQFPIDVLKIDRSFIKNLDQGREFAAIVQAIAQLAHNLGVAVIAEGIETAEQVAMLQTLDCELGQGYLFSRPLAPAAFEAFIMNGPADMRLSPAGIGAKHAAA